MECFEHCNDNNEEKKEEEAHPSIYTLPLFLGADCPTSDAW